MNVLDSNTVPRVMNLRDVLWAFLEHREMLLVRRTKHRLAKTSIGSKSSKVIWLRI